MAGVGVGAKPPLPHPKPRKMRQKRMRMGTIRAAKGDQTRGLPPHVASFVLIQRMPAPL